MITVLRFKDFQGPFTSNSKTFKDLFHFQGLSRPWKNKHFFQGLSRTFKALWPPCCQAWKSCMGSPLPRLALGFGGVVWLHCSCGLSAEQVGSPAMWLSEGTVNLLMSPTVLAWSGRCDLTGSVVKWAGVVALFAIPAMTYCSWA